MKSIAKQFITLLIAGVIQLNAQFTITPVQPPSSFTFNDIWNLNIAGPATSNYVEFYVSLRIYDNTTTNLMVKSNSAVFPFSAMPLYANYLNMGPLNPLSTLYYDYALQSIIQNGGFFPVGVYDIQFILLARPNDGEFTEVAEFDYQMVVDAFWPPMLLDPFHEDTIDNPLPLLIWTPAFYASPGTTIEYSLWMVKLNLNQDRYQAITSNPYILESHNMMGTTLPYPPSAYNMQVGDQFAWQVAATVNNQPIAFTDVWTFVYYVDTIQDTVHEQDDVFFNLKRSGDDGALEQLYSVDEFLKFQIQQGYHITDTVPLRFTIKDKENNIVYNSSQNNYYPLNFGINRYIIDPCLIGLDSDALYYKLEVINDKNEWFYIYFKFAPGFNCNN